MPTTLELDRTSATMEVRESVTVMARVLDQNGDVMPEVPSEFAVTWRIDDPRLVEVEDGVISGTAPGQTQVTAEAESLDPAEVEITVNPRLLEGSLSFDHDGHRTGTFDVTPDALAGSFELTLTDDDENELRVFEGAFDAPLVSEMELGVAAPPALTSSFFFGLPSRARTIP